MAKSILRQIIENKTIPDTHVMTMPDGTQLTLGQLRQMEAEEQKDFLKAQQDLKKQQDELAAQMAKLNTDKATLQTAQQRTAELFQSLQNAGATAPTAGAPAANQDPLAIYENDPAWAPVVKVLRGVMEAQQKLTGELLPNIDKNFKSMAKAYIDDRVQDKLESIPNRDAKISDQAIVQHALANGFVTKTGIPDVRRAYKDLTASSTTEAQIEAAKKEAREAVLKEYGIQLGEDGKPVNIPGARPSGFSITAPQPAPSGFKTIDAALAAAAKDPAIWGQQPS